MDDMVKIYDIKPDALKAYQKGAKHGNNAPAEVIKAKLSSMIKNCTGRKQIFDRIIYKFGSFNMVATEKGDEGVILWIYWNDTVKQSVPSKNIEGLSNTYIALGLSPSGNSFVN